MTVEAQNVFVAVFYRTRRDRAANWFLDRCLRRHYPVCLVDPPDHCMECAACNSMNWHSCAWGAIGVRLMDWAIAHRRRQLRKPWAKRNKQMRRLTLRD